MGGGVLSDSSPRITAAVVLDPLFICTKLPSSSPSLRETSPAP